MILEFFQDLDPDLGKEGPDDHVELLKPAPPLPLLDYRLEHMCGNADKTADTGDDNDHDKDLACGGNRMDVPIPHGRDRHDQEIQRVKGGGM